MIDFGVGIIRKLLIEIVYQPIVIISTLMQTEKYIFF